MKKWIKIPGPGQLRGEGEWFRPLEHLLKDPNNRKSWEEQFRWTKETGYLPTHEGEEPPDE